MRGEINKYSSKYCVDLCKAYLAAQCKDLGADYEQVVSKSRKKPLVTLRHVCIRRLRALGFSFLVIAEALNRDHSTVMYACGWRTKKEIRKHENQENKK